MHSSSAWRCYRFCGLGRCSIVVLPRCAVRAGATLKDATLTAWLGGVSNGADSEADLPFTLPPM